MNSFMTDLSVLAPELALAAGTMFLMIVGAFGRGGAFRSVSVLSVLLWFGVLAALWAAGGEETRLFNDTLIQDNFARMVKSLTVLGGIAVLFSAYADLKGTAMARFEFPVLMGFSLLGLFLMASANDLLIMYMGLELSSLSLYVLAAFNRNDAASSEAGLKYFVLGAISSGLLLFGASLLYGYTGATQFDVIGATLGASAVPGPTPVIVVFGMVLVLAALTFKIAAAPFHMWTPDVYEGAPTSVTAFFAVVPKLGALALVIRFLSGPFEQLTGDWQPVISFIAILSMLVGAFAALVQRNIKRLLAYSSIGNIGYALVGVAVATHFGLASSLTYMAIYMVTSAGMFGLILLLRRRGVAVTEISDLAGLSRTHPVIAYGIAAMMFSMAGIPPLAGFLGKLVVFQAAVAAQAYTLAVIGVLSSVVAAWYYINIIRVMFFEAPQDGAQEIEIGLSLPGMVVVALSLIFLVGFIVMPGPLNVWAAVASAHLLP
ncbi:MAG: NADH-quinone oxidoreductase subunit NuoN [Rhodospirillales bacterium]|nr:NADH-quinone oxidoreductase subunit NuoN [Alphaproteobacteria bacterium]MCB9987353.1 NADH-quinone oxidoreductase subunit NuoN [Rhodospirillales bacterium]USO07798.1 MAG: NADH-quinone oxidoreductase subunit NuoN [Rhodospirillales bacterium]